MGSRFQNVTMELVLVLIIDTVVWVIAAEFHHYTQSIFIDWIHNSGNIVQQSFENVEKIHIINSRTRSCKGCLTTTELNSIKNELVLTSVKNELYFEPLALNCRFFCVTYGLLTSVT